MTTSPIPSETRTTTTAEDFRSGEWILLTDTGHPFEVRTGVATLRNGSLVDLTLYGLVEGASHEATWTSADLDGAPTEVRAIAALLTPKPASDAVTNATRALVESFTRTVERAATEAAERLDAPYVPRDREEIVRLVALTITRQKGEPSVSEETWQIARAVTERVLTAVDPTTVRHYFSAGVAPFTSHCGRFVAEDVIEGNTHGTQDLAGVTCPECAAPRPR